MSGAVASALAALQPRVGTELGVSGWMEVDQGRVGRFVEAAGGPTPFDWIHVDPDRAAAETPFGGTIVPGYLMLSLLVPLTRQVPLPLDPPPTTTINYGLERCRFTSPTPVGVRLRARVSLADARQTGPGLQVAREVTVEREDVDQPAMVATALTRLLW